MLVFGYIQSGNIDLAEQYCYQTLNYSLPESMSEVIPNLLDVIPYLRTIVTSIGTDFTREFICKSILIGQHILSNTFPNLNQHPTLINEQICSHDQLIAYADYYRHQR
ncbi:unnamed protein product [Rotaria sp. Silwood2]|nr:unnamed protein product [Rotaria sp. Silwood2]CAF4422127.1 unnamed protein product [Rotaria sp. Silwood2]